MGDWMALRNNIFENPRKIAFSPLDLKICSENDQNELVI